MILISGTMEIDPAKRERALVAAAAVVAASLAEPGCVQYGVWANPNDPGRFHLFEEWESMQALVAHEETPHVAAFVREVPELGVRSMEIWRYEVTRKKRML